MSHGLLELSGLGREFRSPTGRIAILRDINLTIHPGEFVAIMGPSGSGKSTLMNILGCLDRPSTGSYRVNGQDTALLDPDTLAQLRRDTFGFVFQRYNLLADLNAVENAAIPAVTCGPTSGGRALVCAVTQVAKAEQRKSAAIVLFAIILTKVILKFRFGKHGINAVWRNGLTG